MNKLTPKFRCDECKEIHDEEDEARECCQPIVDEVYECPLCKEIHDNEQRAIECCGYDPDGPPPPPSAAELERMGQQRLFE